MTVVAPRALLPRRAALLLVGDILALTAFAVLGRRTHEEAVGLDAVLAMAETAAPFVLGWLVAAVAFGVMRRARTATLLAMVARTVITWAAAFPLAALARGLLLGRASPWTFYVVAGAVPLLLLLVWRVAFVVAAQWLDRHTTPTAGSSGAADALTSAEGRP